MDHIKNAVDAASFSAAMAALAGWLPSLAALASLIWTLIRIYDWWQGKRSIE